MMKFTFFGIAFLLMVSVASFAQQDFRIVSPELNENNTVTFKLLAPKAQEVKITGNWMAASTAMTKSEKGIWSYTTDVLPSDIYSYAFVVDGMKCLDPGNVYLIRDVANVTNVFIIGGGIGDLFKVNKVPHGTVARRWYESPSSKTSRRLTIYTPPGYESSINKYPVLYLLHGMGGDEEAWITLGRTAQILDNMIAKGKVVPMIVVMSNGNFSQEAAPGESSLGFYTPTFQLPNTMDGKMEETFPDVIRFVESNYRVIADKSSRAIAGLSMGGFHSLHISRYYPNTFDYVGLFSAVIMPNSNATSKVYQDIDNTLVAQKKNGYKLYWIAIGKTDFLYKNVAEYRNKLDKMNMKYSYFESEGGHTWPNWRIYLSEFTPLLFK